MPRIDMGHTDVMPRRLSFALAEENAEAVRRLHRDLRDAATQAGLRDSDIAELMGLDAETVEAALAGRLDLTLSDLQELAIAVGAFVGYNVQPGADRLLEHQLFEDALIAGYAQWEPSEAADDDWSVAQEELVTWSGRG